MKSAIQNLQRKLHDLEYNPGPVDGIMGPLTASAFEEYLGDQDFSFAVTPKGGGMVLNPIPHRIESTHPNPWMAVVYGVMGLHEVRDNEALKAFLRSDGSTVGDPAKIAWCGDLVQTAIARALPTEPFPGRVGENPYLALNWKDFGFECRPCVGAILVFWRGSPDSIYGHVGFYVGEDATRYYVLGGNQDNEISVTAISKRRLRDGGSRWPMTAIQQPGEPRIIDRPELALSVNEA